MQDVRKVQLTHKETLIISLPKQWRERYPFQAGDDVALNLQPDGAIVIRKLAGPSPQIAALERGTRSADDLLAHVGECYVAGADGVLLRGLAGLPTADRGCLRDAATGLFGAALSDETEDTLEVRFLAGGKPVTLPHAVRRLANLAVEALRGQAPHLAEAERIHLWILRLANRGLDGRDPQQSPTRARLQALGAIRLSQALLLLLQSLQPSHPSMPADADALQAAFDAAEQPERLAQLAGDAKRLGSLEGDAAAFRRLVAAVLRLAAQEAQTLR